MAKQAAYLALWWAVVRWTRRGMLAVASLALAIFLGSMIYRLAIGSSLSDAAGFAAFMVILSVITPYSLITTGQPPYIDL